MLPGLVADYKSVGAIIDADEVVNSYIFKYL
jgi:hypothetical protein